MVSYVETFTRLKIKFPTFSILQDLLNSLLKFRIIVTYGEYNSLKFKIFPFNTWLWNIHVKISNRFLKRKKKCFPLQVNVGHCVEKKIVYSRTFQSPLNFNVHYESLRWVITYSSVQVWENFFLEIWAIRNAELVHPLREQTRLEWDIEQWIAQ